MIKHHALMFWKIFPWHPELPTIIAPSMGNPPPEKIQEVLGSYETPGHYLIGSLEVDKLMGVIGIKAQEKTGIIKHIAVHPPHRLQGIGKALIRHVIDPFSLVALHAETDEEAVGFYKKIGFTCQPFEGSFGKRYACTYRIPSLL